MLQIGLDVGSTTLKAVVLREETIVFSAYERHFSQISEKMADMLSRIAEQFPDEPCSLCISGSAGMGIAEGLSLPFMQEVYATRIAISHTIPDADVIIELGGEDAKILFLTDEENEYGGLEVRMNGSCAGGTGAFIDQMSTLLNITPDLMNELAGKSEKLYTVASRCGVFAKSDIQPLLNQGARKEDISASIFAAVVNQTVAGLAQGRTIGGKVIYLGGPLTFLSELRASFDKICNIQGICPEHSLYYVALGAARSPERREISLSEIAEKVKAYHSANGYIACEPLFENQEDYDTFAQRHLKTGAVPQGEADPTHGVYVGIDSGSTTVKIVAIDAMGRMLMQKYLSNNGNPIPLIREFLQTLYETYPDIKICSSAVTGYGEDMIRSAFCVDYGVVETIAHYTAAKQFCPEVDFIIDIGGQDIKCFQIRNGAIDNLFLNEACSSGCGSFLQTFAGALGLSIEEFSRLGLFADRPVDLGSRCTVFMNSSVKQAQKDNAGSENISAGLSISVVKNALYKVIRATRPEQLGKHIIVQGGTFLNDAVLRAFEKEIGQEVIRPSIAGLMGAYGAALYAKEMAQGESSTLLSYAELQHFSHEVKVITCKGCSNACRLTVNHFGGSEESRKFIGGNRCEKPVTKKSTDDSLNLYAYKQQLLEAYRGQKPVGTKIRGKIGLPLGLNFYELLPFWVTFWNQLGFETVISPNSNRKLYLKGQYSIPSDTVCFPAKLLHGAIEYLMDDGVDAIFYPCMSYNLDEHLGDNHYNCPVVAYYPEVLEANVRRLKETKFIKDYLGLHHPKFFTKKIHGIIQREFGEIPFAEVKKASKLAYEEYNAYMNQVRQKGEEIYTEAKKQNLPVIVLSGRPYHLDPEVNHGIDRLIISCGAAIITEDSVSWKMKKFDTHVLDQWTYHSRLYAAAKYVAEQGDNKLNFIQLVSFGCGVDAITTDECREILERGDKIYTQIKIDEITNLGAVKIRLRSLFAAAEHAERKKK